MYASILRLRSIIRRECPDLVISLLEHSSVALFDSLRGLKNRPLLCLGIQNNFTSVLGGLPRFLRLWYGWQFRKVYASADHIVALSQGVADNLISHVSSARGKVRVVYNAGFDRAILEMAKELLDSDRPASPLFVACGRLNKQKDYPTLLRAFSRLQMDEESKLWILGRGPDEAELKELSRELCIADRVTFWGFQDNPFKFIANADVFVLSSAWEGFGNVVVEALALGLPVVSTDCPYGPAEILEQGKYGALTPVGNDTALADAMKKSYKSRDDDASKQARRCRAEMFEAEKISRIYASIFERMLNDQRGNLLASNERK